MPSEYERERDRRRREAEREREERDAAIARDRERRANDTGAPYQPSDFDEGSADIPIWGWLSGAQARRDALAQREAEDRMMNYWASLGGDMPSAGELTPDYALEGTSDEYGDMLGGPSQLESGGFQREQLRALRALQEISDAGGYTDADRAATAALRAQQGQWLRGQNEAALQQPQARGMGGGGQELAARLSASQGANQANVMGDAAIQQAAMQRALGAITAQGGLASTMQGQELQRRSALDAFNQRALDWRRGRDQRNTAWQNRYQDALTGARQQAYQNRERQTAGLTGQYSAGSGERQFGQQRQDAANQAGANALGTLVSEIL